MAIFESLRHIGNEKRTFVEESPPLTANWRGEILMKLKTFRLSRRYCSRGDAPPAPWKRA
jgi:hypothetical protein